MPTPVRRVVTGHDASGKAIVIIDGDAPNQKLRQTGIVSTLLWVTDETPAIFPAMPTARRATGSAAAAERLDSARG
jgi:hypothetical protein